MTAFYIMAVTKYYIHQLIQYNVVVVGFTTTYMQSVPITTNVVSSNPTKAKQHYVIKFVCDLQQVGGFLRVLLFLPPINTDRYDISAILLKVALNTTN